MSVKKFKDMDGLSIEEIIQLPFFRALQKIPPDTSPDKMETTWMWRITFRCNKRLAEDQYALLDEESSTPYIVRYRLIDFRSPLFLEKPKQQPL